MRIRRHAPAVLLLVLAGTAGACTSTPPDVQSRPPHQTVAAPSGAGTPGSAADAAAGPTTYGTPIDVAGLCRLLDYAPLAPVLGKAAGVPQAEEKSPDPSSGRTASCGQKLGAGAESGPGGAVRTYITVWPDSATAKQQFEAGRDEDVKDTAKDGRYEPQTGIGSEGYRIVDTMSNETQAVLALTVRHDNLRISVRVLAARGRPWDAASTADLFDRLGATARAALPAIHRAVPAG
ncbi:hypothetical protein [Kitasatospora sp. NPDC085879]|uniref:hypothetical protein n=1 Tax=Kitasatospora sp. NPDC085879 TaxID=3154769 RepID=UPI00343276BA